MINLFKKNKGIFLTPSYYYDKIPVMDIREWDSPYGGYPLKKYNYEYTGNDLNGLTEAEIKLKILQDSGYRTFKFPHPQNHD